MWDRLNLPILLFKVELLTIIGSQAVTSQAGTHLPPREGSNLVATQATQSGRQAGANLPPSEGSSLAASQAGSQASQAVTSQAGTHLPPGEGSNIVATQATSQAGSQGTRSGRQHPRHSARQMALQASQGNSTASQADSTGSWESNLTPDPQIGFLQGLPQKNPTQSGSLTYPANLWHQHKGLFWLKDPTLQYPPSNLLTWEYITAIEAACTKLSQQDAEELRAEVNSLPTPQTQLNQSSKLSSKGTQKGQGQHSPHYRQGGSYGNYG